MQKWEYYTVTFSPNNGIFSGPTLDGEEFAATLNRLGEEGWELVNIFDVNRREGGTNEIVAVMKRPLS